MAILTYIEALNQAWKEEMRRDERVIIWGQDMISWNAGQGQTAGIYDEFGGDRIKDTPITEQATAGMAIGSAMRGLRPIAYFTAAGFMLCAFDGLFLQIGCHHYNLPIVVNADIIGSRGENTHGQSPEALFGHAPYWKIVMPSTPYDVKGLMKTAIRDEHPVLFLHHMQAMFSGYSDGSLYRSYQTGKILAEGNRQEVPEEEYLIPFGEADIKREGSDITVVTYSYMVHHALEASSELGKDGIAVEVVDLRTIVPLDVATIVKSAKKTGRLLIVHEAMKRNGVAGEIAFRVLEESPEVVASLKTPYRRLAAQNLPLPGRDPAQVPSSASITAVVKEMVRG